MENKKRRFLKNEKGFTLIELIVIIAILAVISAIAVPNILNSVDDSRKTADVSNARIIATAAATVRTSDASYSNLTFTDETLSTRAGGSLTSTDNFINDVIGQLNNIPEPQFHSTVVSSPSLFQITIDPNGVITVEVTDDGTNVAELFPTVHNEYK